MSIVRIRRGYVDGGWGQIHYREAGDGKPLVLLHQSPLSGAMFEPAVPFLASAGFRVVALDTPGFGASDRPPAPQTIPILADALRRAALAIVGEPVFLLGHHTGAALAASWSARHPGEVEKLVLNGVPLFSQEQREMFARFDFQPLIPKPDGSHLLVAWNQRITATPGWSNLDAMHRHVTAMLAIADVYHWGFEAAFAYDIAPDLDSVRCPTLVLTNTGEDLYGSSRAASRQRPDFAYAELEGGTHDIVDEQPEAWAAEVIRFLRAG